MHPAPTWLMPDRAAGDLEGQIYRGLRDRILSGQMAATQRLPSTRAMAMALGVARSTVVHAYDRLKAEGYLDGRPGSATVVAAIAPAPAPAPRRAPSPVPVTAGAGGEAPPRLYAPGMPDLASFPHADWAACLKAGARSFRTSDLGYAETTGLAALRQAIIDHVSVTRGVSATADQVLILPSTRAAIDLLATVLLTGRGAGREDVVWLEEPGYPAARAVFAAAGARLAPVPCDVAGIDVAAALATGQPAPRIIYTTPSHQYPTGVTMTLPRRLALLEVARSAGAIVIEDDYDSEFHYGAHPIAALQGIDRSDVVVYLGTFSKTLAPGLRVAYMIVPQRLWAPVSTAFRRRGAAVSGHIQAGLARFMRDGRLRAHLRGMTPVYGARMRATADALRRHCGPVLDLGDGEDGLQRATWFRDPACPDVAIAGRLAAQGFGMQPMSGFFLGPPRPGLLFGIAAVDPARIDADAARIMGCCGPR